MPFVREADGALEYRHMNAASELRDNGFVILPNILTPAEVATLNTAIEEDMQEYPAEWAFFGDAFVQTVDILPRRTDFDQTIEHPAVLPVLEEVIGPDLTFEEFSVIVRNPTTERADHKAWHRDIIRDYDRRWEIEAISAVYYLTDVGERDHCFSIVPGTHSANADLRPEDIQAGMEVDLLAPAGSVILFHARCLHAGKLKPHSRLRRTLHLYYSRLNAPRTSEWSTIPQRLYGTRKILYAKWNRTDVIDGTGRKPRDLDPATGTADMLKEAQRRAAVK